MDNDKDKKSKESLKVVEKSAEGEDKPQDEAEVDDI